MPPAAKPEASELGGYNYLNSTEPSVASVFFRSAVVPSAKCTVMLLIEPILSDGKNTLNVSIAGLNSDPLNSSPEILSYPFSNLGSEIFSV